MEIFLIRHTSVNVDPHLCYGHLDVPVAESFEEEAKKVKMILNPTLSMKFISSPSTRCTKLAEYLSHGKYKVDERFRELYFGDWEGKSWNLIEKLLEFGNWAEDFVHRTPPNGESYQSLQNRADRAFKEWINSSTSSQIVIITHGGIIRAILATLQKIPLESSFSMQIDFHSITKLQLNNTDNSHNWIIEYINRT
jgi:alpha-ribazole phosphatase